MKRKFKKIDVANMPDFVDLYLLKIVDFVMVTIVEAITDKRTKLYESHPRDIVLLMMSNILINLISLPEFQSMSTPSVRINTLKSFLDEFTETVLEMWNINEASMVDTSNPQ